MVIRNSQLKPQEDYANEGDVVNTFIYFAVVVVFFALFLETRSVLSFFNGDA